MNTESTIKHEATPYWVFDNKQAGTYDVMKDGPTCSQTVQSFPGTADGLSLASAYADYKAAR